MEIATSCLKETEEVDKEAVSGRTADFMVCSECGMAQRPEVTYPAKRDLFSTQMRWCEHLSGTTNKTSEGTAEPKLSFNKACLR